MYRGFYRDYQCVQSEENLKSVIVKIMEEIVKRTNCIVFITDSVYQTSVDMTQIRNSSNLTKYEVRYMKFLSKLFHTLAFVIIHRSD